jgi:hypothetical protein
LDGEEGTDNRRYHDRKQNTNVECTIMPKGSDTFAGCLLFFHVFSSASWIVKSVLDLSILSIGQYRERFELDTISDVELC